jgi:hypothetical protein
MQQTMVHHDLSDENEDTASEDVEWEMCCSTREASFGFVPFANLDFTKWRWNDLTGLEAESRGCAPVNPHLRLANRIEIWRAAHKLGR